MFAVCIGFEFLSLLPSKAIIYAEPDTRYEAVIPGSDSCPVLLQTRKKGNLQVEGINAFGQFTRLGRLDNGQRLIGHTLFAGRLMPIASQAPAVLLTNTTTMPMPSSTFNLLYTTQGASIGVLHSNKLAFWVKEPYTNETVLVDRAGTDYSIGLDQSGSKAALVQCTETAKGSLLDVQLFTAKDGKVHTSRRTWPLNGRLAESSALDGDHLFTTVVHGGKTWIYCYNMTSGEKLGMKPLNVRNGRDALVASAGRLWFIAEGDAGVGSYTWPVSKLQNMR